MIGVHHDFTPMARRASSSDLTIPSGDKGRMPGSSLLPMPPRLLVASSSESFMPVAQFPHLRAYGAPAGFGDAFDLLNGIDISNELSDGISPSLTPATHGVLLQVGFVRYNYGAKAGPDQLGRSLGPR